MNVAQKLTTHLFLLLLFAAPCSTYAQFTLEFPEIYISNSSGVRANILLPTSIERANYSLRLLGIGGGLAGIVVDGFYDRFRNPANINNVDRNEIHTDFSAIINKRPSNTSSKSLTIYNSYDSDFLRYSKTIRFPSKVQKNGISFFTNNTLGHFGIAAYFDIYQYQNDNLRINDPYSTNEELISSIEYEENNYDIHFWYGREISEKFSLGIDYTFGRDESHYIGDSFDKNSDFYYIDDSTRKIKKYDLKREIDNSQHLSAHVVRVGANWNISSNWHLDAVAGYEHVNSPSSLDAKDATMLFIEQEINYSTILPFGNEFTNRRSTYDYLQESRNTGIDFNLKQHFNPQIMFHYLFDTDYTWFDLNTISRSGYWERKSELDGPSNKTYKYMKINEFMKGRGLSQRLGAGITYNNNSLMFALGIHLKMNLFSIDSETDYADTTQEYTNLKQLDNEIEISNNYQLENKFNNYYVVVPIGMELKLPKGFLLRMGMQTAMYHKNEKFEKEHSTGTFNKTSMSSNTSYTFGMGYHFQDKALVHLLTGSSISSMDYWRMSFCYKF